MINSGIMFNLPDYNDLPAWERWYLRTHAPQVMARFKPWQTRYVSYRAVPAPAEAMQFGYMNYRYTQAWFRELPGYPTDTLTFDMTDAYTRNNFFITFNLPPQATEDFMGGEVSPEQKPILRWVTVMKYPEGVTEEEGEDWFLNTHVPEVMKQSKLTRFFSYKCLPNTGAMPGWKADDSMVDIPAPPQFVRVNEMWYENFDGWKESVITNPPEYTKPSWASSEQFPFLKSYEDFFSMFILESPTNDFHKELYPYV